MHPIIWIERLLDFLKIAMVDFIELFMDFSEGF